MSVDAVDREGADLLDRFERAEFGEAGFPHVDHVRVLWELLRRHRPEAALSRFRDGLKQLTRVLGAEAKYHETKTWAFFLLIYERYLGLPRDQGWADFAAAATDLLASGRTPLLRFYDAATLESDAARLAFRMPTKAAPGP